MDKSSASVLPCVAVRSRRRARRFCRGSVVLLGLGALWSAVVALNVLGLKEHTGFATVRTKTLREYQVSSGAGEGAAYMLGLEIDGEPLRGSVGADLYAILEVGDRIEVVYRRRRLTGTLECVSVLYDD